MMRKVLTFVLLVSPQVLAQTVYKTVEDGVTSFSDSPPQTGAAEVLSIETPPVAADGLLEERLAEMRDTTDRMAQDRREREKHRAQLKEIQQAPTLPSVAEQPSTGTMMTTWQGEYWPGYGRPNRPRPPIRPHPPGSPQPQPLPHSQNIPGWSVMQPGNSQLMRPIVSGRRP